MQKNVVLDVKPRRKGTGLRIVRRIYAKRDAGDRLCNGQSRRAIKYVTLADCASDERRSGDRIEGNPSSLGGSVSHARSLACSTGRREGLKGRSAEQPWRTKMEDADRGNVGLAPSGHDGTPIARINVRSEWARRPGWKLLSQNVPA